MPVYLGRYSSDITIKSRTTRKKLCETLKNNIKSASLFYGIKIIDINFLWDYFYIVSHEVLDNILEFIPGIGYFSEAKYIPSSDFSDIISYGEEWFKRLITGRTFAVRARVSINANFWAKKIEIELGEKLVKYGKVNLDSPDVTCFVDVLSKGTFFYDSKEKGIGGLPVKKSAKVVHLISGGIDSPIAAIKMIKRGICPIFLYYDLGNELQTNFVFSSCKIIYKRYLAGLPINLYIVPFQDIVMRIKQMESKYQNLILKVAFYKAAEVLADKEKAIGISTGEAIGQVSTQTIHNLAILSSIIRKPVFRPLLCYSKEEIIKESQELDLFDYAYKGTELCALQLKKVVTKGKREILDKMLNEISTLIENTMQNMYKYDLKEASREEDKPYFSIDEILANNDKPITIIDIRSDNQKKEFPIKNALSLSFTTVVDKIIRKELDPTHKYLLICDYGTLSTMVAKMMQDNQYDAFSIGEKFSKSIYQKLLEIVGH